MSLNSSDKNIQAVIDLLLKSKKLINVAIDNSSVSKTCKEVLVSLKSLNEDALTCLGESDKDSENVLQKLSLGSFDEILTEIDNESKENRVSQENNNDQQLMSTFSSFSQDVKQFILTPV